ncbi:MAG TPA: M56 family metallopeptidase [Candidatus Eremiobacteraceae bacterium]|nr:M56 family metallopeptidase [Candidatus Eremiobacteraceae bacterium]
MISLSHAAWAILNSIWQAGVVAAVAWIALRMYRRASAAVRYYVWGAVLVAALVLPVINLLVPERVIEIAPAVAKQPANAPDATYVVPGAAPARVAGNDATMRFETTRTQHAVSIPTQSHVPASKAHVTSRQQPVDDTLVASAKPSRSEQSWTYIPPAFGTIRDDVNRVFSSVDLAALAAGQWMQARISFAFAAWLAVATLLFARLGWGLYRLRSIKRGLVVVGDSSIDAMCRAISRNVTVAKSDEVGSPCVIGYVHPVVALPSSLVSTLDEADLHRVLAHELGHVRRFDDWANLIQQCIRAALFFNPVVHAACRALDVNREIACDDLVAAGHADRIEYAKCLTEIARRGAYVEHLVPAAGFFPDRRQIIVRIEQLLDRDHPGSARVGVVPAASAIAAIIAVAALAAHQLPALAISAPSSAQPAPAPHTAQAVHAAAVQVAAARQAVVASGSAVMSAAISAELDKARSAEARAAYEAMAKEPALSAADVEQLARAEAAVAAARAQAAAPRIAMAEIRAQIARAPRAAMAVARAQIGDTPRAAISAAMSEMAGASKAPTAPSSEDDFLDALDAAGYKHLTVDDLIAIRNSGVTSSYLRALRQYSVAPMPAKTLIALANSGVSASMIASMYAAGYRSLSADDLIALQNAGVSSELAVAARSSGRATPTVKELVALANAGVSSDYIDALSKNGYAKISVASLIALANAGVSSTYLEEMANQGYAGIGIDSLIALANSGISPAYIRGLADLGYSNISTSDLIRLANAGVTPQMIKTLRAHGITDKLSIDQLIKLANNGF